MKNFTTIAFAFLMACAANAQAPATSAIQLSAYLESYYAYDFNQPLSNERPGFVYSFNRHNEVNLNIGLIKASFQKENTRANLALMTGTYANANLAAEPGVLKNVFEANAGIKLSQKKNFWLDAGIFTSHIGFESAIGKNCWNLTRGILADNSPYYESGVKLSYKTPSEKWYLCGLMLNGWQRIQRIPGNSLPAFGHQLTYTPGSSVTLNSSSFIGSDTPDSTRRMRYFHNFYGVFQLSDEWGLTLGFDIGAQQQSKGSSRYEFWYTPVMVVRYSPCERLAVAARAEYYADPGQVIIATDIPEGFSTGGLSCNFDYKVSDELLWRLEARHLFSKDPVFMNANAPTTRNTVITSSLAVSF